MRSEPSLNFQTFGNKSEFALECRHLSESDIAAEPEDSVGSWGAWRLWVAGINLCDIRLKTSGETVESVQEVSWYLTPLFRWIIKNWTPLLHEKRLPGGGVVDRTSRSAREAYLAMLESAGDDPDKFLPWQEWAGRHSLRSASEGGIVPDVFFQRMEDEIEISWGDRIQPGGEAAVFMADGGVARASVDCVGNSLASAIEWFLISDQSLSFDWMLELTSSWGEIKNDSIGISAISWYLDSRDEPGPLTRKIRAALASLEKKLQSPGSPWLGRLSPEVAMFGDLSPRITQQAAASLLAEYFDARTDTADSETLKSLVSEQPAWVRSSPWHNGYALAIEVLDEIDPAPKAVESRIEVMLENLGVQVKEVRLGEHGPRGVALAGDGLRPTILVNRSHLKNEHRGKRFTLAHELCHILFDRSAARPLTHTSTPWASPSVEQRANAFAAMLLMPPTRAKLPSRRKLTDLKEEIGKLANKLKVSRTALRQHLANIDEISQAEFDYVSPS